MTTLTLDLQALETGNNSFMKITRSLCLSVCSTLAKPPQKSIPAPPHQCLAHRLGLLRSLTDPLGPWDRQSSCRAPRRAHEDIPSKQRLPSEVCPPFMLCPCFSLCFQGHSADFPILLQAPSVIQASCQQRAAELRDGGGCCQTLRGASEPGHHHVKTGKGCCPSPEAGGSGCALLLP